MILIQARRQPEHRAAHTRARKKHYRAAARMWSMLPWDCGQRVPSTLRGPMRCYFNLADASEVIRDRIGIEVSDPERARAEALDVIREQHQADPVAAQEWRGWSLIGIDDTGQLLFSIPLDEPVLFSPIPLA